MSKRCALGSTKGSPKSGVDAALQQHLSASKPLTIEHLVVSLASVLLTPHTSPAHASASPSATPALEWDVTEATVRCSKPSALMFAQYPTVGVTRRRDHFPHLRHLAVPAGQRGPGAVRALSTATASSAPAKAAAATAPGTAKSTQPARETPESMSSPLQTAFIGLGTNLGARPGNLNDAVTRLDALLRGGEGEGRTEGGKDAGRVVETSWMYESEAMYHEEQDKFLNAAIKVRQPAAFRSSLYFRSAQRLHDSCFGGAGSSRSRRPCHRSDSSRS